MGCLHNHSHTRITLLQLVMHTPPNNKDLYQYCAMEIASILIGCSSHNATDYTTNSEYTLLINSAIGFHLHFTLSCCSMRVLYALYSDCHAFHTNGFEDLRKRHRQLGFLTQSHLRTRYMPSLSVCLVAYVNCTFYITLGFNVTWIIKHINLCFKYQLLTKVFITNFMYNQMQYSRHQHICFYLLDLWAWEH